MQGRLLCCLRRCSSSETQRHLAGRDGRVLTGRCPRHRGPGSLCESPVLLSACGRRAGGAPSARGPRGPRLPWSEHCPAGAGGGAEDTGQAAGTVRGLQGRGGVGVAVALGAPGGLRPMGGAEVGGASSAGRTVAGTQSPDSLWLLRPDLGQRKQRRGESEARRCPGGGVAVRAGALAVEGTGSSRSAVTLRGGDVARSWLEVGLQEWPRRGLGRACDA